MPSPTDPHGDFGWRRLNPGRVLSQALQRFESRVLELMAEAGHGQTRRAHVNLTRHLDVDGTRITELARRAGMTNAAMTELIDQCESLALVERVADPADRRARVVRFTPAGRKWLAAFGRAVARATREMEDEVGAGAMAALLGEVASYGAAHAAETSTRGA
ncbi:MAG: winged helix-turn-helix transcriptional regulator [Burkholderiales bacterium]|jgi:DNA-binding MarR family transcriptional regulator|nr:winged helix-turn-helix transcriptional regulator [Burkholderiales bacterium]